MTTYLHFDSLNRKMPFIPKTLLDVEVWVPNDDYINALTDSANDPTVRNFNSTDRISTATNYLVNGNELSNIDLVKKNIPLLAGAQIELCTVILPGNALCIRENKIQPCDKRVWGNVKYIEKLFFALKTDSIQNTQFGIMTSPDGIRWTYQYTPNSSPTHNNQWSDITFGNGLYVAVSASGDATKRVMTSPDGIVWNLQTTPTLIDLNKMLWSSIVYGNGLFVVMSSDPDPLIGLPPPPTITVMTSPDGIIWSL